ncbi:amidohydrolase family protein [Pseudonocardia kongjuensis]|uniref:Amidohydrolase family protein n=2 Tax=Pseudonocardia kongjuensis TaxID=102227 RepID=A0ABP4II34_9PSEU
MVYDLVIRGGSVVDGTGAPPRTADVAVQDGLVVEVGKLGVGTTARRTVDADGAIVTPGFVDIHTHYDGQATWDDHLQPSAGHGVTTAVTGNCGVGFAPVRAGDRDTLVELMEGVEDLPGAVLHEGLGWEWESIGEFLDTIERRPHDIDLATQVCHGPLRVYVMGQRGVDREKATPADIAEMGRLAAEGIEAGALGFSTSRTLIHRTSRGEPIPTLRASRDELVGIGRAIGATGRGVLQVISDFEDFDAEMATLREVMESSGRPLSISVAHSRSGYDYRRCLQVLDEANAAGLTMRAQVAVRAIGMLMGLEGSVNPLKGSATYTAVEHLPLAERARRLAEPSTRATVLAELSGRTRDPNQPVEQMLSRQPMDRIFVLGDPPDYEPDPSTSIAARAAAAGRPAEEVLYDLLVGGDGSTLLYVPVANYVDGNLDAVHEMLAHPHTLPALGDGGAHVGIICDASFPTSLLTHWTRDRTRGPRFDLAWAIRRQCRSTAEAVGLLDRGLLAPGYKADLNVIDIDGLRLDAPAMVADLPAGGRRYLQSAHGYLCTAVSGVVTRCDGEATGELPGRLVRGAQQPAGVLT